MMVGWLEKEENGSHNILYDLQLDMTLSLYEVIRNTLRVKLIFSFYHPAEQCGYHHHELFLSVIDEWKCSFLTKKILYDEITDDLIHTKDTYKNIFYNLMLHVLRSCT